MLIDGINYYPIKTAVEATGITEENLKILHRRKQISCKVQNSEYLFSAEDIQSIKHSKDKLLKYLFPVTKHPDPVPKEASISLPEAAELTGYKPSTLRNYFDIGKIPGHLIDGKPYFTPEQIERIKKLKEAAKPEKKSDLEKAAEKIPDVTPVKKPVKAENIKPHVPKKLKSRWKCAQIVAHAKGKSTIEYLLEQAESDIERKRDALKALRE